MFDFTNGDNRIHSLEYVFLSVCPCACSRPTAWFCPLHCFVFCLSLMAESLRAMTAFAREQHCRETEHDMIQYLVDRVWVQFDSINFLKWMVIEFFVLG